MYVISPKSHIIIIISNLNVIYRYPMTATFKYVENKYLKKHKIYKYYIYNVKQIPIYKLTTDITLDKCKETSLRVFKLLHLDLFQVPFS